MEQDKPSEKELLERIANSEPVREILKTVHFGSISLSIVNGAVVRKRLEKVY